MNEQAEMFGAQDPSSAAVGRVASRLTKYFRGQLTMQYRVLAKFARSGQITTAEINRQGEKDWRVQRSVGQRIRDCRSEFGLDVRCGTDPDDSSGNRWTVSPADQERARALVADADRRSERP